MPARQTNDLSRVSEADDTGFGPLLGKFGVILLLIFRRFIGVLVKAEYVKKCVNSCWRKKFLSNYLDFRTQTIEACIYILVRVWTLKLAVCEQLYGTAIPLVLPLLPVSCSKKHLPQQSPWESGPRPAQPRPSSPPPSDASLHRTSQSIRCIPPQKLPQPDTSKRGYPHRPQSYTDQSNSVNY
jgi:hypothetical protein